LNIGWRSLKKWYQQVIAISIATIIIVAIYYEYVEDQPIFDGDVWGDLQSTGEVVGVDVIDSRRIAISSWGSPGTNASLILEISNISRISMHYWDDGEIHETNYTLINRSLLIDASNRGFFGTNDLVNGEINYDFREFSGYWVDEFTYRIHTEYEFIDGMAQMSHDHDYDWDFTVDWETYVYFDNFTLTDIFGHYRIPEGEVADIKITGSGNLSYIPDEVHINGTLTIEDFEPSLGHIFIRRNYELVRIDGEDILVRTITKPRFESPKGHDEWDPWVIEIDVSDGTDSEIHSDLTFTNKIVYFVNLVILLILYFYFKNRYRRSVPPKPKPIEFEPPPRIQG
jgi:hypothetical protein